VAVDWFRNSVHLTILYRPPPNLSVDDRPGPPLPRFQGLDRFREQPSMFTHNYQVYAGVLYTVEYAYCWGYLIFGRIIPNAGVL
jgi:hypothetical protein